MPQEYRPAPEDDEARQEALNTIAGSLRAAVRRVEFLNEIRAE
jgi:hypothetical protein